MKAEKNNFREFLRDELIKRCRNNPSYSLRAFAKNLQMDGSTLSKIINGKRPIGKRAIYGLGVKLGLKEKEIRRFHEAPASFSTTINAGYDLLADDIAEFISEWHYYAILELLRIEHFAFSVPNISKAIGLPVHEIAASVERLQRLNLIKLENDKATDLTSGRSTNISTKATSYARRTQQKQVLAKAIAAIDEVPVELRSNTSMTFAIDTQKLGEAAEVIKKFRREMAELLSRGVRHDEVYNLSVALYPVSQIKTKLKGVRK